MTTKTENSDQHSLQIGDRVRIDSPAGSSFNGRRGRVTAIWPREPEATNTIGVTLWGEQVELSFAASEVKLDS